MWQHRSSPLRKARLGLCGSAGAHLIREARSGAEKHVAAPELTSTESEIRDHVTHDGSRAHLYGKM
jgi:hypothetical protein